VAFAQVHTRVLDQVKWKKLQCEERGRQKEKKKEKKKKEERKFCLTVQTCMTKLGNERWRGVREKEYGMRVCVEVCRRYKIAVRVGRA